MQGSLHPVRLQGLLEDSFTSMKLLIITVIRLLVVAILNCNRVWTACLKQGHSNPPHFWLPLIFVSQALSTPEFNMFMLSSTHQKQLSENTYTGSGPYWNCTGLVL